MSQRDRAHVLEALWQLSGGEPGVGVPVPAVDDEVGRRHGDMRTPLDLQQLGEDNLAARLPDGSWALTPEGIAWRKQDRELSDR